MRESSTGRRVPAGVHLLTGIHGLGSVTCLMLSIGSGLSDDFRTGLAATEGGQLMVDFFGQFTWAFLAVVAVTLASLAYGSWKLRPFAWPMTLIVYSIAVAGSLWKVMLGIDGALLAVFANAAVVLYAARPAVRAAYGLSDR